MTTIQRILLFFLLPFIAPILYPPIVWVRGYMGIIFAGVLFVLLGILLLRGRSTALTLSIFLQGLNVIIRLMMFFPHATRIDGSPDIIYIIVSLLSICLSLYLVLRLDRVDVRVTMVQ
jgi:hypothetical protein